MNSRESEQPIATLPPLPVLEGKVKLSPHTGEPPRVWSVVLAHVIFQAGVVGTAVAYSWHWYRAVHRQTYPLSAHLIQWVQPAPGKWLSLTLEACLAALVALTAGMCGVAGFQAWNGSKSSRVASVAAVACAVVTTWLLNWVGLAVVIPAVVGTILLWLPPSQGYFRAWTRHRATQDTPYRRPDQVYYGRLPRYR